MKTYPFTREGLDEFVAYLGSDPYEVLIAERITGVRGEERCCVVANAFKAAFPDLTSVQVTWATAFLSRDVVEIDADGFSDTRYEQMEVRLPEQVGDLIQEFDDGERPELEKPHA